VPLLPPADAADVHERRGRDCGGGCGHRVRVRVIHIFIARFISVGK
jgi:hypothetical protein